MFEDETFSSEYMDDSESFDPEVDFFQVDNIIDDRVVTKSLLDAVTGQMVEAKHHEYLVVWKGKTQDMNWEREDRLREDGCGDLIDCYLDCEEIEEYKPPSKKELKRVAKEEKRYEKKHMKKIRSQMERERANLVCFEDFQLAGASTPRPDSSEEPASEEEELSGNGPTYFPQPLSITSGWKSSRARCPTHKVRSPSF